MPTRHNVSRPTTSYYLVSDATMPTTASPIAGVLPKTSATAPPQWELAEEWLSWLRWWRLCRRGGAPRSSTFEWSHPVAWQLVTPSVTQWQLNTRTPSKELCPSEEADTALSNVWWKCFVVTNRDGGKRSAQCCDDWCCFLAWSNNKRPTLFYHPCKWLTPLKYSCNLSASSLTASPLYNYSPGRQARNVKTSTLVK